MLIIEEEQPEALAQEPEENKQAAAQDAEDGHPDDDDEDAFGENDSEDIHDKIKTNKSPKRAQLLIDNRLREHWDANKCPSFNLTQLHQCPNTIKLNMQKTGRIRVAIIVIAVIVILIVISFLVFNLYRRKRLKSQLEQ